jgi:uncharacterized membrane protein (DUF441 family)
MEGENQNSHCFFICFRNRIYLRISTYKKKITNYYELSSLIVAVVSSSLSSRGISSLFNTSHIWNSVTHGSLVLTVLTEHLRVNKDFSTSLRASL